MELHGRNKDERGKEIGAFNQSLSEYRLRRGGQAPFAPRTPQKEPVPGGIRAERELLEHFGMEKFMGEFMGKAKTIAIFPRLIHGQVNANLIQIARDIRRGVEVALRSGHRNDVDAEPVFDNPFDGDRNGARRMVF